MVCASVREDNQQALASGLYITLVDYLPVQMHKPYSISLSYCTCMHLHLIHFEIFDAKLLNIYVCAVRPIVDRFNLEGLC